MEGASGKRKDAPGDEDVENSNVGAHLVSASNKRRFVPPKMTGASAAGGKEAQPLASRANQTPRVGAKPAANPAPEAAASSADDEPTQYFKVLYCKKSNKVSVRNAHISATCQTCHLAGC